MELNNKRLVLIIVYCLTVTDKVAVSGVWFDYNECNHPRWGQMEESLLTSANNGSLPPTFRPTLQVFTDKTVNKYNPVGYVGGELFNLNVKGFVCLL